MNDFNIEDVVIIYKDTPTFKDGTVGQIIDRDPNDNSYAVADLRDIGKADRDISVILNRYVKWVKPENMRRLEFDKPLPPTKLEHVRDGIALLTFLSFITMGFMYIFQELV